MKTIIKTKYFSTSAKCLPSTTCGDKIEIPADVYDAAARAGTIAANFVRGAYDYEVAKIFAQSKRMEALTFDTTSGEITTSSTVGISAEITFAMAIWNGYNRNSAIERAILSGLKNNADALPKILADKISPVNIADSVCIEEDFAKHLAGKSASYVKEKIQAGNAIGAEVTVNVPRVPQLFQRVGDTISQFGDEIILIAQQAPNIRDYANGRISGKQILKNSAIIFAGMAGTAAAVTIAPFGGIISTLFIGFGGKIGFKNKAKQLLDKFIADDSKELLKIFDAELTDILRGKFLTQYELEILMEAIHDAINEDALKDMYQYGKLPAQKKWAHDFIERCLQAVEGQRFFVAMPSPQEWQSGFERVSAALNNDEDICARMEFQHNESLQARRKFLDGYNLKPYEIAQAVGTVNAMSQTQLAIGRTLTQMQENERQYRKAAQNLQTNRADIKRDIRQILSGMGGNDDAI